MKAQILNIILSPLFLWTACSNPQSRAIDFIPGTYVNQAQSEYSVANDTLIIEAAPNTEDIYLLTKKTGYRRIAEGKEQNGQYRVKKLTGTWDPQKQMLQIMQNGTLVTFQPDQNKLMIGSSEYWKR
jgi:hypothetical protein